MDASFSTHWPLPGGLDFAKGRFQNVAAAIESEVRRFIGRELLSKEEMSVRNMSEVFGAPRMLDNVGLHYFIIPTHSEWTAIWTSTFLCAGYDSLSFCLTQNHGFETVHFHSSDSGGPFQPGTVFSHRSKAGERNISAIQEDARWIFHVSGTPLPEEDVSLYQTKKISARWNSTALLSVLGRIHIRPWSDDYYDLSAPVIHLERRAAPRTVARMSREEFTNRHQTKTG
jgi:hypothetical protein